MGKYTPGELVAMAADAAKFSTSKFKMGAALETEEGKVFTGCNQTCAVSPLSMCAERCAVFKAVSEGYTEFTAIAVVGSFGVQVYMCGACRQVLRQYSLNMPVYTAKTKNDFSKSTLDKLLPESYGPELSS